MSVKLSELKDDDMLLVGDDCMTKEDLLNDLDFIKNHSTSRDKIYTTIKYVANIDAQDMIESALEREELNMHDDWLNDILKDVTVEDIKEMQLIVDRILSRRKMYNVSYTEDEKVEIDM